MNSSPDVDSAPGVLIDGPNRVGLRGGPDSGAVFLAGAALCALVLGRARVRTRAVLVGLGLVLAAWPGLRSLWEVRADGPAHLASTEAGFERLSASIESFARKSGCAKIVESRCTSCDPVARFALAPLAGCASPAGIVLREDAWSGRCTERGPDLECGTDAPRPQMAAHVPTPTAPESKSPRSATIAAVTGPRQL